MKKSSVVWCVALVGIVGVIEGRAAWRKKDGDKSTNPLSIQVDGGVPLQVSESPFGDGDAQEQIALSTQEKKSETGVNDLSAASSHKPTPPTMLPVSDKPELTVLGAPVHAQELEDEQELEDGDFEETPAATQAPLVVKSYKSIGATSDNQVFNPEAKRKDVENLVESAITFVQEHSLDEALAAFDHDKQFFKGELCIFLHDTHGVFLAHGQESHLIWQNRLEAKDEYGLEYVKEFIRVALAGVPKNQGGWTTYKWRHATKVTYVKAVEKDGKTYVVGCGYYPHSKIDAVVNLVKGAVALFTSVVKQGRPKEEALSPLNYPLGPFVFGDLYLYALDFNGNQLVHGELPTLVGINAWNYRDSQGKLVNQEIIAKLKNLPPGRGVWVDYISKNAPKRAYAERVVDAQGNDYFIASGYYPDANADQAINLVERGYRYMKAHGKSQAARLFTDKAVDEFRYGDLFLFVFTQKGICVAHGGNPSLVGTNMYNARDEDGTYYVQDFIAQATTGDGSGWIDYREKKAFASAYVEKIDIGETFVIGCSVQPITKRETMMLLVKSATDYLEEHTFEESMREFVKPDGKFVRGDLSILALQAQKGICFAAGDDYNLIWNNLTKARDDHGVYYIKEMMQLAENKVPFTMNYFLYHAKRVQYTIPVEKKGKKYLLGSGFYL